MTVQQHNETKTVTEETEIIDSVTCDICLKVEKRAIPSYEGEVNWPGDSSFAVEKTQVVHASGVRYPDGGTVTYTILHICPECFHEHVLPLAKGKHTHESVDS